MRKYVLTGGPGSGKSSIILALEQRGEYVIREAAEDYIKLRQAQGTPTPWKEADFQQKILDLQVQRESRINPAASRVFIDRGIHDGLAYAGQDTETYNRILEHTFAVNYEKIFLVELLDDVNTTAVRRENTEQAKFLEKLLYMTYWNAGYDPMMIVPNPLDKRVEDILRTIDGVNKNGK
jgi:predicted ATPase